MSVWGWRWNRHDSNPGQVLGRDVRGKRVRIEVHAIGEGRVVLRLPGGESYELDPLEGVGRLRAVLRDKALESSAAESVANPG
jgi:hypothetical protein